MALIVATKNTRLRTKIIFAYLKKIPTENILLEIYLFRNYLIKYSNIICDLEITYKIFSKLGNISLKLFMHIVEKICLPFLQCIADISFMNPFHRAFHLTIAIVSTCYQ